MKKIINLLKLASEEITKNLNGNLSIELVEIHEKIQQFLETEGVE